MPEVRLVVGGDEFVGWEEVAFKRSIEALSAAFSLKATFTDPFPVEEAVAVQLYFDGDKVLDGHIDSIDDSVDPSSTRILISGRDKAADLIDASALHDSQEFKNIGFADLLNKIASPFGVSVSVKKSGIAPFAKFSLQHETAFEAMNRAAGMRGVFLNADSSGNIVVEEYGAERSGGALVMGQNIKSYTRSSNFTDRFSEYIVRGQQQGTDDVYGLAASSPEGKAKDLGMTRYRPLVVIAEGNTNKKQAEERAQWEATVRAARSVDYIITVTGWRVYDGGPLWAINTIVPLVVKSRGINQDMLIREVSFSLNSTSGFTTTLKLSRPDAFQKAPEVQETDV